MTDTMFESAGRLFFTRTRIKNLEKEINIAGINMPADSFAGYVALNAIVATVFLTLLILFYPPVYNAVTEIISFELPFPVFAAAALAFSFVFVYLSTMALLSTYLLMNAENRRNKLETALPDFLTLVASNIKAGMALDQAMWYSAKPEFGVLSDEVKAIVKSSFSGETLEHTLDKLAMRFDSRVFKRTIMLLKQASATGGELTDVLERTSDDVRNTIIMKKEIAASLVLYEIFVLFAAIAGTPFLFAVAAKLIQVFENIIPETSGLGGTPFSSFGGFAGAPVISSSDFFWFSIPTIFVTALISSFIVSAIRTGSKGQGMKYFPFVLILSYVVYFFVTSIVDAFFSAIA
ncbi:type II secretion system F family protein [Candidatus Micrarchaeota archaeon]|nr:type II secretion system F family protein [Candidatus Micrarchaeota archaeon]